MKGIILAGGIGTRLFPSTKVTNKHLLPVYSKPMIFYPIHTLIESGIRDILIISSRFHMGDFMELLGSGEEFQANFTYKVQEGASGIAQALSLAENFIKDEPFGLVLGDNIFTENFSKEVEQFENQREGAWIFLQEISEPTRFGVAELRGTRVIAIEEKPISPKSSYAVTGLYFYDGHAFEYLKTLKPSHRGELEITDLNNLYVEAGKMEARFLKGAWIDAGTHDSLLEASNLVREKSPEFTPLKKDKETAPKVTAGLLFYESETYQSDKYFEPCFASLLRQDYPSLEIYVLDNGSPVKANFEKLKKQFPQINFIQSEKNLGFGGGHNHILRNTNSPYYACLNFDMIFEPDFISQLMAGIRTNPDIGSVTGKLKRWDFERYLKAKETKNTHEEGKTNFIDSVGVRIRKSHRFEDRGQGEVDYGQYDGSCEIFGCSGASALFRRAALESVAFSNDRGEKEYFDELFFMYKEDIDLAYRLQWAGFKALYVPRAVAYHDRTVVSAGNDWLSVIRNRRRKSKQVNEWSFINQEILLKKHFMDRAFSHEVKKATKWYKLKSLAYILLFEPHLLRQYRRLSELEEQIEKRILRMPRHVKEARIESFME